MASLTIFHTSDIHNKLTSNLASILRNLKENNPDCLMLDSGDAIWAGNIIWRPGGEPVFDLMNSVPYDAMCMGNREFHFRTLGLCAKTSRSRFPVLSANLRNTKGAPFDLAKSLTQSSAANESRGNRMSSAVEFNIRGVRIIVFGLTVPCITEQMLVKRISSYYFEQPIIAAAEIVPKLRSQCDLLIALTHIGMKADRELASTVRGIDLILGGHTHIATSEPEWVSGTCILHHGCYAHYVGRVDIDWEPGMFNLKNELIPLVKA